MNISRPISSEIDSVSFSFYDPQEIRNISVKQITNPTLFDNFGHPTKGGLYDPSLGPFRKSEICGTCSQNHFKCPGHFGHIELPMPTYHPLFFDTLYALLRAKCNHCHKLKATRFEVRKTIVKLELLQRGLLQQAQDVDDLFLYTKPKKGEEEKKDDSGSLSTDAETTLLEKLDNYLRESLDDKEARRTAAANYKVTVINDVRKRVMSEFLKVCVGTKRCQSCQVISPPLRREGSVKFFQLRLTKKDQKTMEAENAVQEDGEQEKPKKKPAGKQRYLSSLEVRKEMERLFKEETDVLTLLYGANTPGSAGKSRKARFTMFFIETLAVSPTRFRPPSVMADKVFESAQNQLLSDILKASHRVSEISGRLQEATEKEQITRAHEMMLAAMIELQHRVNSLIDSTKNPDNVGNASRAPPGIRQALEKKEGLFRKHMMGKRVNFAARSVISPDPYIETSEIGVPMVFATKLTYPEPVTAHNFKELRQAVINGPTKWPGATHVQHEDQSVDDLSSLTMESRVALANSLLAPRSSHGASDPYATRTQTINKKVLRHIRNGDMVLMNRQPTLHKPSIMAHKVRVLPGEKTIRMHYANCNTYNADFDGDEMNMHFPQNEIARAEASFIANNDNQYLVPTSGNPLRGLIQDHVVSGVWMTSRNSFFTKDQYHQLLYACLRPEQDNTGNGRVLTMPPTVIKPQPLWTGKQIISTILLNLTTGKAQLNMESKSKVPGRFWGPVAKEEEKVLVMDGELITGVLDKSQFGATAYGLVHAVYELYGAESAGKLLSILGRLFITFVQTHGFTCRMDDLILTEEGDKWRRDLIDNGKDLGREAHLEYLGLAETAKTVSKEKLQEEFELRMQEVARDDNKLAGLDNAMKSKVNKLTSSVTEKCLPHGLVRQFPHNDMQMMTVSGAKGSNVNAAQISCMLGQQELEGRRVPLMMSGRSLPSFMPYDTAARAGGFVSGRFLTGISPQEYYFHCMAGREGLIDTAVKTSRSGYLQRCLIKHLEGLSVQYDHTVRDSDGSILQFNYGEDSLDVTKAKYLNKFGFSAHNYAMLSEKYNPKAALATIDTTTGEEYTKKALKKPSKYDPALSVYSPSRHLGVVSESFALGMKKYVEDNPDNMPFSKKTGITKNNERFSNLSKGKFRALMHLKYLHSLVDAGEAVGLLAAQSVGEPSTQMTLNTFHFAGYGAANVTLGIPRLREIIMTAARVIKTPTMLLPLKPDVSAKQSSHFCKRASRLTLSQIIDNVVVVESMTARSLENNNRRSKVYSIRLNLFSEEEYKEEYRARAKQVKEVLATTFIQQLENAIRKDIKASKKIMSDDIAAGKKVGGEESLIDDSAEVEAEYESDHGDGDATDARLSSRTKEAASYEPDDEDEEAVEDSIESEEAALEAAAKAGGDDSDDEMVEVEPAQARSLENVAKAKSQYVTSWKFDDKHGSWCEVEMTFPADTKKILMVSLIERVTPSVVLHEIKGIQRCFEYINPTENDTSKRLQTEGVNLKGMWQHDDLIDMNCIDTNDIAAILETYGVEAARNAIIKEIGGVFAVYGITVDRRHLTLIADYMTFEGGYKPFNRIGLASNTSPFLKMSFESTCKFLTDTTLHGDYDTLESPSARIVMGKVVEAGTGSFQVLQPLVASQ